MKVIKGILLRSSDDAIWQILTDDDHTVLTTDIGTETSDVGDTRLHKALEKEYSQDMFEIGDDIEVKIYDNGSYSYVIPSNELLPEEDMSQEEMLTAIDGMIEDLEKMRRVLQLKYVG